MTNRKEIYQKLVDLYDEKCYICGQTNVPLEIEHVIPVSAGGTDDFSNLRLICRQDNAKKSNKFFREVELVEYLYILLSKNKQYSNIQSEVILPGTWFRGDIITKREINKKSENLLIEVKSIPTFTRERLNEAIAQLKSYKQGLKNYKLALAFPGNLSEKDNKTLNEAGIEVWDMNFIASTFANEIASTPHPILQPFFTSVNYTAAHDKLINELKAIKPGNKDKDWSKYQKHIEKILDYLFGNVLSSPISELSDHFKINRRDFILRNYAESGFWSHLRNRYFADFIVLDAKNYSKNVTKKEVLQISNYLKIHGAGLFGIIISRKGGDKGSYYTCREIWAMDKKLVIVLDDNDIIKMIIAKASSNAPEEIIRQKIEEFRLSM